MLDFGEPIGTEEAGQRPAVVVSDDGMNDGHSGLVIVVPITSTRRALASHVELDDPSTGFDEICYARCEDIMSTSERCLTARLGVAPSLALFSIDRVLRLLLSL